MTRRATRQTKRSTIGIRQYVTGCDKVTVVISTESIELIIWSLVPITACVECHRKLNDKFRKFCGLRRVWYKDDENF